MMDAKVKQNKNQDATHNDTLESLRASHPFLMTDE